MTPTEKYSPISLVVARPHPQAAERYYNDFLSNRFQDLFDRIDEDVYKHAYCGQTSYSPFCSEELDRLDDLEATFQEQSNSSDSSIHRFDLLAEHARVAEYIAQGWQRFISSLRTDLYYYNETVAECGFRVTHPAG